MADKKKEELDDKEPKNNTPNEGLDTAEAKPEDHKQKTPVDALSRTPEDLAQAEADSAAELDAIDEPIKKVGPIRRFLRAINVYFLIFIIIVIVSIAFTVVNYLNANNDTPPPSIAEQELTEDALQQLANSDATVGNNSQTLTIKGNAIIDGQTLMRGNLNIAGNLQTGGSIQGPNLTISGTSNLGTAQINSLQVAQNLTNQGNVAINGSLSVAGTSSFSGAMTASRITVTDLILSGNASLQIPNHLRFTGPTPNRTPGNALGNGGSVSIQGSDTSGTVNVNTGNSTQAGCFTNVTFSQGFTTSPRVIVSPVEYAAGLTDYYVTRSQSGFSICTSTPAPANSSFGFDYFIAG